jgi:hypothetical protein
VCACKACAHCRVVVQVVTALTAALEKVPLATEPELALALCVSLAQVVGGGGGASATAGLALPALGRAARHGACAVVRDTAVEAMQRMRCESRTAT